MTYELYTHPDYLRPCISVKRDLDDRRMTYDEINLKSIPGMKRFVELGIDLKEDNIGKRRIEVPDILVYDDPNDEGKKRMKVPILVKRNGPATKLIGQGEEIKNMMF